MKNEDFGFYKLPKSGWLFSLSKCGHNFGYISATEKPFTYSDSLEFSDQDRLFIKWNNVIIHVRNRVFVPNIRWKTRTNDINGFDVQTRTEHLVVKALGRTSERSERSGARPGFELLIAKARMRTSERSERLGVRPRIRTFVCWGTEAHFRMFGEARSSPPDPNIVRAKARSRTDERPEMFGVRVRT
jgi:hypothetical protein